MPNIDPVLAARSRIGMAVRWGNPDEEQTARRDLKAALLERAIREAEATAPPLTDDQRAELAALLTGGAR